MPANSKHRSLARKKTRPAAYARSSNKRQGVPQTEIPKQTLTEALKVPRVIIENFAGRAPRTLNVAMALHLEPKGGQFRRLAGAATAYGLTTLDKKTGAVVATDLARRIIDPKNNEDALHARREATLLPQIIQKFLKHYDGERFPNEDIAKKMLIEMGATPADAAHTLTVLTKNADDAGFLRTTDKSVRYVDLKNATSISVPKQDNVTPKANTFLDDAWPSASETTTTPRESEPLTAPANQSSAPPEIKAINKKVFIVHGKNRGLLPALKRLIAHGGFEPEIAIERESVSKPVTDKVIDGMRNCIAAVIIIDADRHLYTEDDHEEIVLNNNVMIEVGAALALYKRKFILLVQKGIQLPSDLQGLYTVIFNGEDLDLTTGLRILDALKDDELTKGS